MSYYCVIYTDKPLESILEKHPKHPKTWAPVGMHEYVRINEGDLCKDPNGADELHLTDHFYSVDYWVSEDRILCVADDYLRMLGGRIYVIELSLCEDIIEFRKLSKKVKKTLDLKDVSKELHKRAYATNIDLDDLDPLRSPVSLEPYVIYEVVNSGYEH